MDIEVLHAAVSESPLSTTPVSIALNLSHFKRTLFKYLYFHLIHKYHLFFILSTYTIFYKIVYLLIMFIHFFIFTLLYLTLRPPKF